MKRKKYYFNDGKGFQAERNEAGLSPAGSILAVLAIFLLIWIVGSGSYADMSGFFSALPGLFGTVAVVAGGLGFLWILGRIAGAVSRDSNATAQAAIKAQSQQTALLTALVLKLQQSQNETEKARLKVEIERLKLQAPAPSQPVKRSQNVRRDTGAYSVTLFQPVPKGGPVEATYREIPEAPKLTAGESMALAKSAGAMLVKKVASPTGWALYFPNGRVGNLNPAQLEAWLRLRDTDIIKLK